MEIGEFSKKTNISIDTLRYYNKICLLVPKRVKNIRQYDENDLEKAEAINKLKDLDFSLNEIKMIYSMDEKVDDKGILDDETKKIVKEMYEMIENKHMELEVKENEIREVKKSLERMEEKIKKLFEVGRFF